MDPSLLTLVPVVGRFPFLRARRQSFAHFWLVTTVFCLVVVCCFSHGGSKCSLVWMRLWQDRGQEMDLGPAET